MNVSRDALSPEHPPGDVISYCLATLFGIAAAWLDIRFNELALTSMVVFTGCLVAAFLRPGKPWRWILIVGLLVPALEWLAYSFLPQKPYRAQIPQSLIAFVPGIVGGVGGAVGRAGMDSLFGKK